MRGEPTARVCFPAGGCASLCALCWFLFRRCIWLSSAGWSPTFLRLKCECHQTTGYATESAAAPSERTQKKHTDPPARPHSLSAPRRDGGRGRRIPPSILKQAEQLHPSYLESLYSYAACWHDHVESTQLVRQQSAGLSRAWPAHAPAGVWEETR